MLGRLSTVDIHWDNSTKGRVKRFMGTTQYIVFSMVFLFYALFGDDIRILLASAPDDDFFFAATLMTLAFFTVELSIKSYAEPEFVGSVTFWLDLVSTLSLILDVGWFGIVEHHARGHDDEWLDYGAGSDAIDVSVGGDAARAGRATRAGTRTTRVLRLVRLFRVVRVAKFGKHLLASKATARKEADDALERLASNLDTQQLKALFMKFDENQNGTLDRNEVGRLLQKLGQKQATSVSSDVTRHFLHRMDEDENGVISWEEFKITMDEVRFEVGERKNRNEDSETKIGEELNQIALNVIIMVVLALLLVTPELTVEAEGLRSSTHLMSQETSVSETCEAIASSNTSAAFPCEDAQTRIAVLLKRYNDASTASFPAGMDAIFFEAQCNGMQTHSGCGLHGDITKGDIDLNTQAAYTSLLDSVASSKSLPSLYSAEQHDFEPHPGRVLNTKDLHGKFRYPELFQTLAQSASTKANGKPRCLCRALFLNEKFFEEETAYNSYKIIAVIGILMCAAFYFTTASTALIIRPIDRMVSLVNKLALNPLAKLKSEKDDEPSQETSRVRKPRKQIRETEIVEATLVKIASLVQIGLGEAGSTIIQNNMQTGSFNPMVPGKKIYAAFGFCDIRRFTDATECLGEDVMIFTNRIGKIVHGCVHAYEGAANKNIGDAFLLVWKISNRTDIKLIQRHEPPLHLQDSTEAEIAEGDAGPSVAGAATEGMPADMIEELGVEKGSVSTERLTGADNALLSFLKTMVEMGKSADLNAYANDARLLKRFEPPYKVKMGYGLHVGWAIEGAIGSTYKIDASYLAPDVNMASRLEAATKQFRTPILLSHWFYALLSPSVKEHCRAIDCVTVKGSIQPMCLYTCDVLNEDVERFQFVEDIEKLQKGLPDGFFAEFKKGCDAYFAGKWDEARTQLQHVLTVKPEDGPSVTLLEVIENGGGTAPEDWSGYRALTEK